MVTGSVSWRPGDFAAILTHLKRGDILYVEGLESLEMPVADVLYTAMQDFILDIVVGKGTAAKNVRLNLPGFTVIASTTHPELLPSYLPMLFSAQFRLDG